jgi:hypothetical protein
MENFDLNEREDNQNKKNKFDNITNKFTITGPRCTNQNGLLLFMIILNCFTYVILLFINSASSNTSLKIFKNSVGNISDKYQVDITPAGWTFATW